MTVQDALPAPGERFNFAQHLLQLNVARAAKPAFIDDRGMLRYPFGTTLGTAPERREV